jgi:hypothetical protein
MHGGVASVMLDERVAYLSRTHYHTHLLLIFLSLHTHTYIIHPKPDSFFKEF